MDTETRVTNIKSLIITFGIILTVITVGTFAWLSYRSKSTAMVLTIGDINDIQITLKPYQLDLELSPILTYTSLDVNEEYVTVTVTNNNDIEQRFSIYYDINEIDSSLISSDFKWTLLRTNDNNVTTGNFVGANTTDAFYILSNGAIPANTTYSYRVYTWVDGTNNPNIENASFKGELRAYLGGRFYAYLGNNTEFYKDTGYNDNITSISFVNEINIPNNAANWSVGVSPSNASDVKAWLEDDGSGKYALKVGANGTVFARNLAYAFFNLSNASNFDLNSLNTSETIDMANMFKNVGRNATTFSLNLGSNFNTINVINMFAMFRNMGHNSIAFNLNLGSNFDTSNVENMVALFYDAGFETTTFNLNLGNKFDTSNAVNMAFMFYNTGSNSMAWEVNLGNKFNTINVINMCAMFRGAGYNITSFNLTLGDKFNTSNVTDISHMFDFTARNAVDVNLDLGNHFDTSNVTNMYGMFHTFGYNAATFSLDLGNQFNTSKVTDMNHMFTYLGQNASTLYIDLGNQFNMSNVTNTYDMFYNAGKSVTTGFSIDLSAGNFANVTVNSGMFNNFGNGKATIYVKDSTAQQWIINGTSVWGGTNFSASNVLIK